jgi:opine dehydrogenase
MKTVAILGGGGTGLMMAADNVLRGNRVRLWEDEEHYHENLAGVEAVGGIEAVGNAAAGFAEGVLATGDLRAAVSGADVVLIASLTARHAGISQALAPLVEEGQAVCFSAGNASSIGLRRLLAGKPGVPVGEMSGNVYPARVVARGKVLSAFPYKPKAVAAFPARDTPRLIAAFEGVYEFAPTKNVLAALLNSPNIVAHLAGTLLNAGAVDRNSGFALYRDGLSESVFKVVEAVETEKIGLLKKMGYPVTPVAPMLRQVAEYGDHPEYDLFRTVAGPSSLSHRYVTEDAYFGQRIFLSLAETLGIDAPVTRALVLLAGTINGTDYLAEGVTLEALGITGKTPAEINEYLENGA